MHASGDDRPLAEDLAIRADVERWLNSIGYLVAYGMNSARHDRRDPMVDFKGLSHNLPAMEKRG